MKLLYVVQAYGHEVFGGAESHCRMMATRMADRGHQVEVVTSCATHYERWTNVYEAGTSVLDGVTVHRLAVDRVRDLELTGPLSGRVLTGHKPVPLFLQDWWVETQGPHLPELQPWLDQHASNYDAVIFFTYLYYPTVRGLAVTSGTVPTVLHPLLHDEPELFLDVFDSVFTLPDGIAFSTAEEAELGRRRSKTRSKQAVIGIGVELDEQGSGSRFRHEYGLGDDPYLVCVGRLDPSKGSQDLYDYFTAYKQRNPSALKLVLVGEPVHKPEPREDILITGWVDRQMRNDAVAGAEVSINPSYFESFSMSLTEAWVQSRPALVNGRCDVLAGQVMRSGGGIPYHGFAQFEAALDMILHDDVIARRLGSSGRLYVEQNYDWKVVLDRYEQFLQEVIAKS